MYMVVTLMRVGNRRFSKADHFARPNLDENSP